MAREIQPDPEVWDRLSPRERQVFKGVVRGMTDDEIGRLLKIAEATVKVHLRGAYLKCGVHRRTALISRIYRLPDFMLHAMPQTKTPAASTAAGAV